MRKWFWDTKLDCLRLVIFNLILIAFLGSCLKPAKRDENGLEKKAEDSARTEADSSANIYVTSKSKSAYKYYSNLDEIVEAIPIIDQNFDFYSDRGLELSKKEFCLLKHNCESIDTIEELPPTRQIILGKIQVNNLSWVFIDNAWLYPPTFGHSNYSVLTLNSKLEFIQESSFFLLVKSGPNGSVRFFVKGDILKIEEDNYDCIEVGEDYECDMKTKRTSETIFKLLDTGLII